MQSSGQSRTLRMPFPALILEIVLDFLYSGQAERLTGIDTLLYNKISSVSHGLAALRGLAQEEAIWEWQKTN